MNKLKARIDAFNRLIVDAKAANVWDSIEAACIMAGWSNVAGALTPLKGTAPTNNGFIDSDLDAGIGLAGDGSSYVDSNYAYTAGYQNDCHLSASISAVGTTGLGLGYGDASASGSFVGNIGARLYQLGTDGSHTPTDTTTPGLRGVSRSSAAEFLYRYTGSTETASIPSSAVTHGDFAVFGRQRNTGTPDNLTDATLSWYSIGSSVDLAALDTVVSQLAADLRAIDEDGFDPLATDYIRRVEAADGAYLETGVKQAINAFIVGCRKDGILDALKASCILCGARTISGALVPLVGPEPTAEGAWASGDYDRATGMKGNGSSLYLDTNRANDADGQDDNHNALYYSYVNANAGKIEIGAGGSGVGANNFAQAATTLFIRSRSTANASVGGSGYTGLAGFSRNSSSEISYIVNATAGTTSLASEPASADSVYVFARNSGSNAAQAFTDARLAFYSIGSSLSLSNLDNRVSTLISSIATALS